MQIQAAFTVVNEQLRKLIEAYACLTPEQRASSLAPADSMGGDDFGPIRAKPGSSRGPVSPGSDLSGMFSIPANCFS